MDDGGGGINVSFAGESDIMPVQMYATPYGVGGYQTRGNETRVSNRSAGATFIVFISVIAFIALLIYIARRYSNSKR